MCWLQQAAVQCGAFPVQCQAVAGAEAATLTLDTAESGDGDGNGPDSDGHDNLDRGNSENGYG